MSYDNSSRTAINDVEQSNLAERTKARQRRRRNILRREITRRATKRKLPRDGHTCPFAPSSQAINLFTVGTLVISRSLGVIDTYR